MESKKKIQIELEITNEEAVELFKSLSCLEARWDMAKSRKEEGTRPLDMADSLSSFLHSGENQEMSKVMSFMEENYLFCRSLMIALETAEEDMSLDQNEFERLKTWFFDAACGALKEVSRKEHGIDDLQPRFQLVRREELKMSEAMLKKGEDDFNRELARKRKEEEQEQKLRDLLRREASLEEIAQELGVSVRTVRRKMTKLGLSRKPSEI